MSFQITSLRWLLTLVAVLPVIAVIIVLTFVVVALPMALGTYLLNLGVL